MRKKMSPSHISEVISEVISILISNPHTMKQKKNELWKLDLLEVKFTKASPRFPNTKKLLNAKNNSQLLKKLPQTRDEARAQIKALKSDLFSKKFHGSKTKLLREVQKKVKTDQRAWTKKEKSLTKFFKVPANVELMVTSKLIKLVFATILTSKDLKTTPPDYITGDLRDLFTDKLGKAHPSSFFITYCQNDNALNGYISKLWNSKEIKALIGEIEWSFRKIRGDLTQAEKDARAKLTGQKVKSTVGEKDEENESDGSESDDESDESGSDADSEMDAEEAFDKYAAYDNLVGDSDDEQTFQPDPNVNYNEVTDEEASDDDDDEIDSGVDSDNDSDSKADSSSKKYNLPELATGYFSGGSDDEELKEDKVVKEATTVRKNRRGQRARQKIWEQKYGSKANHVKKERDRIASEREQKQMEFEERQKRREAKAAAAQKYTSSVPTESAPVQTAVHPSWEAKKRQEEKLKNVKFQGKKITFD